MTSMRVQDRILLTVTELALIESSGLSRITAYTSAQLNDRIARVRRFWDKYPRGKRRQPGATPAGEQETFSGTGAAISTTVQRGTHPSRY
jgi:hypothetical protein